MLGHAEHEVASILLRDPSAKQQEPLSREAADHYICECFFGGGPVVEAWRECMVSGPGEPVSVVQALAAMEAIIDRHVYHPVQNPDGPIHRRDGKFIDEAPALSGTPTERLLWLALWAARGDQLTRVTELSAYMGAKYHSILAAQKSLCARGIIHRIEDPELGLLVALNYVYTRRAAQERVVLQEAAAASRVLHD